MKIPNQLKKIIKNNKKEIFEEIFIFFISIILTVIFNEVLKINHRSYYFVYIYIGIIIFKNIINSIFISKAQKLEIKEKLKIINKKIIISAPSIILILIISILFKLLTINQFIFPIIMLIINYISIITIAIIFSNLEIKKEYKKYIFIILLTITPIIYTISNIDKIYIKEIINLNPIYQLINNLQNSIINTSNFSFVNLIIPLIIAINLIIFSVFLEKNKNKLNLDKKYINKYIFKIIMIIISFSFIPTAFIYLSGENIELNNYNFAFTLSSILLFSMIGLINNKKACRVVYSSIYIFFIVYMLIQYFNFIALNNYASLFDIYNLSEGTAFLNFLTKGINKKFYLILLLSIILYLLTLIGINKIKNTKTKSKSVKLIIIINLIIFSTYYQFQAINRLNINHDTIQENIKEDMFNDQLTNLEKYNKFTNRIDCMKISNLYHFFQKDLFEFINKNINLTEDNKIYEQFRSEKTSSLEKNKMTGKLKGENLIIILLESVDYWVINEETTPALNKMKNNGINFNNHYSLNYNGGRTQNTEFVVNTGFYLPKNSNVYASFNNDFHFSLANLFNEENYETISMHNNNGSFYDRETLHKSLGYNNSYFLKDMNFNKDVMLDTVMNSEEIYSLYTKKDKKFMSFIITYSGHGPYVNDYYCPEKSQSERECYDHRVGITDKFLEELINQLENDDLLNNTTFVVFGDHYPYGFKDKEYVENIKKSNKEGKEYLIEKTPFIIWNNRIESLQIDKITESSDILPTIANLFDLNYDSKFYLGEDIFDENFKEFILLADDTYVGKKEYYDYSYLGLEYNDFIINSNFIYKK